jgi:hypothetical protein
VADPPPPSGLRTLYHKPQATAPAEPGLPSQHLARHPSQLPDDWLAGVRHSAFLWNFQTTMGLTAILEAFYLLPCRPAAPPAGCGSRRSDNASCGGVVVVVERVRTTNGYHHHHRHRRQTVSKSMPSQIDLQTYSPVARHIAVPRSGQCERHDACQYDATPGIRHAAHHHYSCRPRSSATWVSQIGVVVAQAHPLPRAFPSRPACIGVGSPSKTGNLCLSLRTEPRMAYFRPAGDALHDSA